MRHIVRRPSWITVYLLVVGIWLLVSVPLLGLGEITGAWANAVVVGAAVIILAVMRHLGREYFEKVRWMVMGLGGWLVASPFVAGYFWLDAALYNAVVAGCLLIVGSILSVAVPTRQQAAP